MTKPADDLKPAPREKAHERLKVWLDDPEAKRPEDAHDRSNEADVFDGNEEGDNP